MSKENKTEKNGNMMRGRRAVTRSIREYDGEGMRWTVYRTEFQITGKYTGR